MHTDEISDILKSRIFHTDTATVSNFTSIYTEIHEKSQPSLESFFFIFKRFIHDFMLHVRVEY